MLSPEKGSRVGLDGIGWFVDLALTFPTSLSSTGFTHFQITGPGGHNNIAPFPGTFSLGPDDRLPGLVVLLSTTSFNAPFSGPGTNLANLFNLTGITHMDDQQVEIWDTWIIGAPFFGVGTPSTLCVAVVDDLNGDGIYNDAPAVVPDLNGDGAIDGKDLRVLGVASNIKKVKFFINPSSQP